MPLPRRDGEDARRVILPSLRAPARLAELTTRERVHLKHLPPSEGTPSVKATNPTSAPLYATIEDKSYEILPGASVDVDERAAMLLAEYGALVDRAAVDEALEEVFTPFAEHGPGVDPNTGEVVDAEARARFEEAVGGDTSKTAAKVADLSTSAAAVGVDGTAEHVTSAPAAAEAPADKPAEEPKGKGK